jgi:hypothetical protein
MTEGTTYWADLRRVLPRRDNERFYIVLLIAGGLIGRLLWLIFVYKQLGVAGGEAQNIAQSIFRDLTVADAFGRGSGLTAHTNPLLPIFAGLLYRLFGWGAAPAEIILIIVALSCVFGAALLFYDCMRRLGVGIYLRLFGLALFCALPINLRHEMVMFRVWEGALSVLLIAFGMRQLIIYDRQARFPFQAKLIFALTAAVGLFLNPAAGLTLYAAGAIFIIRNMSFREAASTAGLGFLVLALVLAPWTIRNMLAFDRFVPLRSNAGLELAAAFHPGVLSGRSDPEIYTERWKEIHPFATQAAFDRMQREGGEQAYAQRLGQEAVTWMRQNPALTMKLAIKHLGQFYFPPTWQSELWGGANRGATFKAYTVAALTALALIAGILFLTVRGGAWVYPLVFMIVPALPYALVQPTDRYHYLISTISIYLAASLPLLVASSKRLNLGEDLHRGGGASDATTVRSREVARAIVAAPARRQGT